MTARGAGDGETAPAPRVLFLVPSFLIFAAAVLTPASELFLNQGDVRLYLEKAAALASGQLPYRDFPLEYPPLALVPMVVPYLTWPFGEVTLDIYKWLFASWQGALMLALGFVLVRIVRLGGDGGAAAGTENGGPPTSGLGDRLRNAGVRLSLLTAGAALALTWRFDLFPALLVMVALWAALDGRAWLAGFVIALGVLAKLYPLAVAPALAIPWLMPLDLRRLVRYGLALSLTLPLVMLPFWLVAGDDAFAFLSYQAERGLQIESIGGGLAVLGGLLAGRPPEINHLFSSVQVSGAFAETWLAILPVLTAVGFALLGVLGWRRVRREAAAGQGTTASVVKLAGAAVLVLIATSKVFSIQYAVWLVPFAALLPRRQFWLAAAMVSLTMPIHPLLYADLIGQEALPILVLNLRNGLLVALLAWVLWDVARHRAGGEVARPAGLEPTTFRSAT